MSEGDCTHPTEALEASFGIFAKGLLTDWRYWALGFGLGIVGGIVTGVLQLGGGLSGAFVGAPMGLYAAWSLGRIRKCGKCGKIVRFSFKEPPPAPPQREAS